MRRRTIIAALVGAAVALSTGMPLAAQAETSTSTAHARYTALAGSATHLLYSRTVTTKQVVPGHGGTEYVLDRQHRSTRVPAGWTASLLGDRPLLTETPTEPQRAVRSVRWRLPESHRSGTTALPEGGFVAGAAPDGWVAESPTGTLGANNGQILRLARITTGGTSTDLGTPYTDGSPFVLTASDAGLLAFSYPGDGGDALPDGTVKYMSWSHPGSWRTLFPRVGTADRSGYDVQCGLATALAACSIEDPAKLLLLPLAPAKQARFQTVAQNRCIETAVPLAASAVWTVAGSSSSCRTGTLRRLTLSGHLQRSTRTYSRFQQPVVAMGRMVVASTSQRTLFTLQSIQGTPKRLIGG